LSQLQSAESALTTSLFYVMGLRREKKKNLDYQISHTSDVLTEARQYFNYLESRSSPARCLKCSGRDIILIDVPDLNEGSSPVSTGFIHPDCGGHFTASYSGRMSIRFDTTHLYSPVGVKLRDERASQPPIDKVGQAVDIALSYMFFTIPETESELLNIPRKARLVHFFCYGVIDSICQGWGLDIESTERAMESFFPMYLPSSTITDLDKFIRGLSVLATEPEYLPYVQMGGKSIQKYMAGSPLAGSEFLQMIKDD